MKSKRQTEKVGACVRMQARLHGYTVSLSKGQDKNVVLYNNKNLNDKAKVSES